MDADTVLVKSFMVVGSAIWLACVIHLCRRRCSKNSSWYWPCYARLAYYLRWSGVRYEKVKPETPDEESGQEKKFPQGFASTEKEMSPSEQRRLLVDSPRPTFRGNTELITVETTSEKDVLPDLVGESKILTERGRWQIHKWLPNAYKYLTWRRRYASSEDGNSFRTFYRATQSCGPHLVLIRTAENYRFGTFVPHNVIPEMRKIPSNEIFVFRFLPQNLAGCFRRSGLNENLLCAKSDSYLLGSKPSILLSDGFRHGCSNPSATFDSPMLSKQVTFNIISIEIWQIKC